MQSCGDGDEILWELDQIETFDNWAAEAAYFAFTLWVRFVLFRPSE